MVVAILILLESFLQFDDESTHDDRVDVAILILLESFLQSKGYRDYIDPEEVAILILLESFLQCINPIKMLRSRPRRNPYFIGILSAIKLPGY